MKKILKWIGIICIISTGFLIGGKVFGWSSDNEPVYMPEWSVRYRIGSLIDRNTDGEIDTELPTQEQIKKYAYEKDPEKYLLIGEFNEGNLEGIQYLGENVKKIRFAEINDASLYPVLKMNYIEEIDFEDVKVRSSDLQELLDSKHSLPKLKVLIVNDEETDFKDFSLKYSDKFKKIFYNHKAAQYPAITLRNTNELRLNNPIKLQEQNGGTITYTSSDDGFKMDGKELVWDMSEGKTPESFEWEYHSTDTNREIVFKGHVDLRVDHE